MPAVTNNNGSGPWSADLLLNHAGIITMDAQRRVLRDGSIAVAEGRIVAVGPSTEVAPMVRATEIRDLKGALVHPGFIDAHVHPTLQLVRGVLPDFYEEERMVREYGPPSAAEKTEEEEYSSVLLASMEMVHNGTTTFADTGSSKYLSGTVEAVESIGMRGLVGHMIKDSGDTPGWFKDPATVRTTENNLERLEDQITRFKKGRLSWSPASLLGLGTASDTLLLNAKELSESHDVPLIMHQSWSKDEVDACQIRTGLRPIEHLAELGILGPNTTLVHMIHVDDNEIDILAQTDTNVVHCPAPGIKRGYGAARIGRFVEMLNSGVSVALGCDAANWANSLDIGRAMYLACLIHREVRGQVPAISEEMALEMATIHGARAVGMAEEIGSLEVGKRADIVIHNTTAPETHPAHNLVTNLVYSSLTETVDTVLVNGNPVLEGGKLTNINSDEAYARTDAAAESLCARIGFPLPGTWPVI